MTKPLTVTRLGKTNPNPIVDRTKQSTAEDWNEDKAAINNHADLLHVESREEALSVATSHTITFDSEYADINYCFVKLTVFRIEISGEYTTLPIKNLVKAVGGFTFDTYTDTDLRIDYFIMQRQLP